MSLDRRIRELERGGLEPEEFLAALVRSGWSPTSRSDQVTPGGLAGVDVARSYAHRWCAYHWRRMVLGAGAGGLDVEVRRRRWRFQLIGRLASFGYLPTSEDIQGAGMIPDA